MSDPFDETVLKLTGLAKALRQAARDGRFAAISEDVEKLRQYSGCAFCVKFRASLTMSYNGVCDACPCHAVGVRAQERPRAYNGCYVRAPYREMVRMAQWFRQNPDAPSAEALANACEAVVADMRDHEKVLR